MHGAWVILRINSFATMRYVHYAAHGAATTVFAARRRDLEAQQRATLLSIQAVPPSEP